MELPAAAGQRGLQGQEGIVRGWFKEGNTARRKANSSQYLLLEHK